MQIYDLDFETRFSQLKNQIDYLNNINESMSEKREKYRLFAQENSIDFISLETCCRMFERTVLIDAYTLSEQLVKSLYYELIEKDRHENDCLNKFINSKVNTDKFSPNVKYNEIEKRLKQDLLSDFKFIYSKSSDEIQSYNSMVDARHKYAHSGSYLFNNNQFNDVVAVIDYLYMEFIILIENKADFRIAFQEAFRKMKELVVEVEKKIVLFCNDNCLKRKNELKNSLKTLRDHTTFIVEKYDQYLRKSILLENFYNGIKSFKDIDLRSIHRSIEIFDLAKSNVKICVF